MKSLELTVTIELKDTNIYKSIVRSSKTQLIHLVDLDADTLDALIASVVTEVRHQSIDETTAFVALEGYERNPIPK